MINEKVETRLTAGIEKANKTFEGNCCRHEV
jgi:hypothetical protein